MDIATFSATLVLLSAANQRLILATDWIWVNLAKAWVDRNKEKPSNKDSDTIEKDAKGQIINLASILIGTVIAILMLPHRSPLFSQLGLVSPGETLTFGALCGVWFLVGLMIAGGTETTNSLIVYLSKIKKPDPSPAPPKPASG